MVNGKLSQYFQYRSPAKVERLNGRHGRNPDSKFQEEDFERCTVLLYH